MNAVTKTAFSKVGYVGNKETLKEVVEEGFWSYKSIQDQLANCLSLKSELKEENIKYKKVRLTVTFTLEEL